MTDKRSVRRSIRRLERIKTWQLVVLLILVGFVTATFLRLNNIGMVERRTAVVNADKSGDEKAIANNLYALQRYSASHMNASSGVIYLEESYKRQAQKLIEQAKQSSTVDRTIIERADEACRAQFPGYSQAYVQCNASEQAKYTGSAQVAQSVVFPNPELYRHDYISPLWSPDFAGLSVAVCFALTGVIIMRLLMLGLLRLLLHRHYSEI